MPFTNPCVQGTQDCPGVVVKCQRAITAYFMGLGALGLCSTSNANKQKESSCSEETRSQKVQKSMYINAFQFSIFGDAKECVLVGLTLIIRY